MKATFDNSRIEIWCGDYINNPERRDKKDINVKIVQIEPTVREDDFIVEVIDRAEVQNMERNE